MFKFFSKHFVELGRLATDIFETFSRDVTLAALEARLCYFLKVSPKIHEWQKINF